MRKPIKKQLNVTSGERERERERERMESSNRQNKNIVDKIL